MVASRRGLANDRSGVMAITGLVTGGGPNDEKEELAARQ